MDMALPLIQNTLQARVNIKSVKGKEVVFFLKDEPLPKPFPWGYKFFWHEKFSRRKVLIERKKFSKS